MRVALYGGSFDPPHVGHAMVAAWLRWTDQADQVWLVPVGGHAFGKALSPFDRRLDWTGALAGALGPRARVEPSECRLPPPTCKADVLDHLAAAHPAHAFSFVVGADNLATFDRWHRAEALLAAYPRLVVGRAGHPSPDGVPVFPDVSSTAVRAALARGDDVSGWVPAPVLAAVTDADRARFRARLA